jgi:hypothetical protein
MYLGISYSENKKRSLLIGYSLIFGIFGFMPHSFILMLILHTTLSVYFAASKQEDAIKFFFIPLAIYTLINIPAFLIAKHMDISYPQEVTTESIQTLSRNGELVNLLAFSNNWWPQVPSNFIFNNEPFRLTSIAFFIIPLLAFFFSYNRLKTGQRALALALMLSVFAVILVAQGKNSDIMEDMISMAANAGLSGLLGPFREWARVGLAIPVQLITVLAIAAPWLKKQKILASCLTLFLLINIMFSPAWIYLQKRYAAVYIIDDFVKLRDVIEPENKVLWKKRDRKGMPVVTQLGKNTTARIPTLEGVGSGYPYQISRDLVDAPEALLDALNIGYVIKIGNVTGYGWWDCEKLDYLEVCRSEKETKPLSIYSGTILTDSDQLKSIAVAPVGNLALSAENESLVKLWGISVQAAMPL